MVEKLLNSLIEATRDTQIIILIALTIIAAYAFFNFLRGRAKVDQVKAESEKITMQHLERVETLRMQSDQETARRFSDVLTQMASVITSQLNIHQAFTGEVKNIRVTMDGVISALSSTNTVTTENTRSLQSLTQAVQAMISDANQSREKVRLEMIDRSQKQMDVLVGLTTHIEKTLTPSLTSVLNGLSDVKDNVANMIEFLKKANADRDQRFSTQTDVLNKLVTKLSAIDQSIQVIDRGVKVINEDYQALRAAASSQPVVESLPVTGTENKTVHIDSQNTQKSDNKV